MVVVWEGWGLWDSLREKKTVGMFGKWVSGEERRDGKGGVWSILDSHRKWATMLPVPHRPIMTHTNGEGLASYFDWYGFRSHHIRYPYKVRIREVSSRSAWDWLWLKMMSLRLCMSGTSHYILLPLFHLILFNMQPTSGQSRQSLRQVLAWATLFKHTLPQTHKNTVKQV